MEEENKERDQFNPKRGGIDGDQTQEKRKGEKTSNPVVNTKSAPKANNPSTTNLPLPPNKKTKNTKRKQ